MHATDRYHSHRGGSSDYRWSAPVSRSSSSASKKRVERSDSLSKDKTASISPHNVMSGEEGNIKEMGSVEKKRFKILNPLERKGLTQKQKELEEKIGLNPFIPSLAIF